MSKPTPGPWAFYKGKLRERFPVIIREIHSSKGAVIVAWSGFDSASQSKAEIDANCRLIAAAPELLEACKEALAGLAAHSIGATDSNKQNSDRNVAEVRRIHGMLKSAIQKADLG